MFGRLAGVAALSLLTACSASLANEEEPSGLPADQQAFLDACEPWDEWDKPAPPFKIYGDSYYVGTCGISAILITGNSGHILLDSGTVAGARVVESNIESLGFEPNDILLLGYSHEHYDHVGGMAYLQELTGATLVSLAAGAAVMRTGRDQPGDPQSGMHEPFAPVRVDIIHQDGDAMGAGQSSARSIATPGHTPGGTSWEWESCENQVCKTIVYADSLSPVSADGYRFSDHPDYVVKYRAGLDRLAAVDCDILLAAHPSHGQLFKWFEKGGLLAMEAPCSAYAAKKHRDLDARLAKEAAE